MTPPPAHDQSADPQNPEATAWTVPIGDSETPVNIHESQEAHDDGTIPASSVHSMEGPAELDPLQDPDSEPLDDQSIARNAFAQLGALLLDAGYAVTDVQFSLAKVAQKSGHPEMSFAVFPYTVMVSDFPGRPATVVNATGVELTFWTSARVNALVRELATGKVPVSEFSDRVSRLRTTAQPVAGWEMVVGSILLCGGLATLFRIPWWAVLSTAVIGAVIGVLIHLLKRVPGSGTIVMFVAAFFSTAAVGMLAHTFNLGPIPLFAVAAPLAVLVPGATITNAMLELSSTDLVTGSSRLIYGVLVLAFMTTGIGTAAMATGLTLDRNSAVLLGEVSTVDSVFDGLMSIPPLWVSWIGVVAMAFGISLAFKAGPMLTALSVPALMLTYAGTVYLSPLIGAIGAAGVVSAVAFFLARSLERWIPRAPAIVTFRPVFLLLVPGTVSVVAFTSLDDGAMLGALGTFISVSIGTKIGAVVSDLVFRSEHDGAEVRYAGA